MTYLFNPAALEKKKSFEIIEIATKTAAPNDCSAVPKPANGQSNVNAPVNKYKPLLSAAVEPS